MNTDFIRQFATWIVNNSSCCKVNLPAIVYGLELIFNSLTKILIIITSGYILGVYPYIVFALFAFSILRLQAGGYHSKSSNGCLIAMLSIIYSSIVIGKNIIIPNTVKILILILCNFIIYIAAPAFTENNPIHNCSIIKKKKRNSLLIINLYFGSAFIIHDVYAEILILIILFESITLLPWLYKYLIYKLGGNRISLKQKFATQLQKICEVTAKGTIGKSVPWCIYEVKITNELKDWINQQVEQK